ncbi:sugar transferase [Acholeplasma manati]|uniref:Sugar transferase n=1 Tax=Paracholeplasma manati TaxID=591373 RepID=A0ABT2Y432_9MOLU|nr:sugar transferase [Paracholeplasma manati]MCV2231492.1 sugar transferase [Paracholeplasma manati]
MYNTIIKRIMDLLFAIILVPFFILLTIFLGTIIYLDDRGPIFYKANRLGLKTRTFKMYKFRTMKVNSPDLRNSDGSTYNSDNDPRLTRFGKVLRKTSLDELPQLLNILKGDMSFIGPRPDLSSQIEYYILESETKFNVKPGITGYAQVNGRNDLSWDEKNKLDRYYVQNISLFLDIVIFFKTIIKVLKREGVNKNG